MLWYETEFGLNRSILPHLMTCRIDLSPGDDRQDAVHQLVECLVGGGLARLRTETSDDLIVLAAHSGAAMRLAEVWTDQVAALMVSSPKAVADFVPSLPRNVDRLFDRARRPIHLSFADGVDNRILQTLPSEVSRLAGAGGGNRFAIPHSDLTRALLRLVPSPLAVLTLEEDLDDDRLDLEVHVTPSRRASPPALVRFDGDEWVLAQSGEFSEEDVTRMTAERIVFVCTGNTCRSPMAEGLFRKLLAERLGCAPESLPQHGFDVASAGIAAMNGAPASHESVEICATHGVDLRSHASQSLQLPLVESSDRLYTMTAGHRDAIQHHFPTYADRVQLLSRQGRDVSDPIGSGWSAYERCFSEISENLRILVEELAGPK